VTGFESTFRISVLKNVAWGPSVKTGANVPSYSGGVAVWLVVLCLVLFWGRISGFAALVLRDVAWRPSVKTGASVPSCSGGFAAWLVGGDQLAA
jgi:hypothetical protein